MHNDEIEQKGSFNPYFSSVQAVSGSVVIGNYLYFRIFVAKILPKMLLTVLTFGEHFVENEDRLIFSDTIAFLYFF